MEKKLKKKMKLKQKEGEMKKNELKFSLQYMMINY